MQTGPVPQRSLESLRAATDPGTPRGQLARTIPRRPRVSWWLGLVFALAFAALVTPAITADRWLAALGVAELEVGQPAPVTIRVPPLAGMTLADGRLGRGGLVIARGEIATSDDLDRAAAVTAALPQGTLPYVALFVLTFVLAGIFTHHMRRSTRGRLVRVQLVSLVAIAVVAVAVKIMLLASALGVLVVPVAVLALVPTMALDRIVGLATGVLAALVVSLLGPFDVGVAIVLLVQVAVAGLVVAEQPKDRWRAALAAGAVTTLFTAATYVLSTYLTTGALPAFTDPLHSPWFAAALGPAVATVLAVPLLPLYQLLVGEITQGKLIELEDMTHPLLKQIAEKAPGTWQHSLMMANLAEIAANAIGASGRLVRVGAYYHDLGKSLQPKYFIENLEPGETSPHDKLPPEVSCDAIFAHVTEGIVAARKAGLHERIVDFMHMHHGNGVLEYFWGKCTEEGNPRGLTIEQFRYPGHPPQSRETAILAICDAVEAASRTLKKPDAKSIDALVQRIVYGKLHLGQLDESGLSMGDLRRVADSLRETIRHANHGRIEYPWQKAQQDASADRTTSEPATSTSPRLDSLDRAPARRETTVKAPANAGSSGETTTTEVALAQTADVRRPAPSASQAALAIVETAPAISSEPLESPPQRPSSERVAPAAELALPEEAPPERTSASRLAAAPAASEPARRRRSSAPPLDPLRGGRPPTQPPAADLRAPARPSADGLADPDATPDARDAATTGLRRRGSTAPPPLPRPPAMPAPPPPAPDGLITPASLGGLQPARKRAATLPPTPIKRAPTVPPPARRPASQAPPFARTAGPPDPVDLENAVTNPPPIHRPSRDPVLIVVDDEPRSIPSDAASTREMFAQPPERDLETRVTGERAARRPPEDDAAATAPSMPRVEDHLGTEPSLPRLDLPLKAPPSSYPGVDPPARPSSPSPPPPPPRRDAHRADGDEWSIETPVIAPTPAELRSLLGSPDPTRQVPLEELEAIQRAAADEPSEPDILQRRIAPMPTAEVDPEDIEAAIEVAPPARRAPSALAVAKPKKSE